MQEQEETLQAVLLQAIRQVDDLEARMTKWRHEMAELESIGVWDTIPTPSWETRNNNESARYLRLVFPADASGHRRKEYVGNHPQKQYQANRKISRTRRHREMEDALSKLAGNLVSIRSRVEAVRRELETQESWSSAFVPDTWGAKDEHFQGRV